MASPVSRLWLTAALAVPLLLGGCGTFGDDAPQTTTLSSEAQPAENESYPNLGTVPSERPTVTTQEQREALQQGLREQRRDSLPAAGRQPSDVSGGSSSGTAGSQPPAPPTPSIQSAPSQSSLTPTQRVAQASAQPQNTAPQNTSQYASQQQAYADGGVLLAGQTPPDMLPPMAYNQSGYGGGTTVISSQGAAQPSGPAARYDATVQPGSQTATAGYGDAYAGADDLAGVIYFNHGSAGLSGNDRQVLRNIADAQKARGGTLIVVGHASARTQSLDPETHFEANLEMSQRRANAVAEALRGLGVSSSSLFVEGRGAVQPVYQEVMPTGEAGNRRVEIFLR
ncbi:MAG: OmpA family protein [Rhodovibrionaceae bacterium]